MCCSILRNQIKLRNFSSRASFRQRPPRHAAQHVRRDEPGYHNHIMRHCPLRCILLNMNITIALSLVKRAATSCCTGQAQLCGDSSGARKLVSGKKRSWNKCSGFNMSHTAQACDMVQKCFSAATGHEIICAVHAGCFLTDLFQTRAIVWLAPPRHSRQP